MQFKQQLKHAASAIDFSQPGIYVFITYFYFRGHQLMTGIFDQHVWSGAQVVYELFAPISRYFYYHLDYYLRKKRFGRYRLLRCFL